MPNNPVAENVLGTIGTILWTCQIIPQIWKSWREKSTAGLSAWLMFIWALAGLPMGTYLTARNVNIPLIIQPQIFASLAALSWSQCLYYNEKRSFKFCFLCLLAFEIVFAGFETGFTLLLKPQDMEPKRRALQFMGIFSTILISLGLFPQYYEIWKRKEVIGISMVFMAIDMLGGLLSLLSLVFKPTFDGVASLTYIAVIVLDGVVVICAIILNPMARRRRARELGEMEERPSTPIVPPPPESTASTQRPPTDSTTQEKDADLESGLPHPVPPPVDPPSLNR